MTLLIAILGLISLIVIHELGHMLTAKALGVRVPEFSVGFGPALFQKKIGKTIYSFRIILLGGFAKMAGMEGASGVEVEKADTGPDTYPAKPPWRKALIIFAGPFANLVAAVLILAAFYMIAGVVTGATTTVKQVVPNSLASSTGVQSGDRVVSIDGTRTKDWEKFVTVVQKQKPGDRVSVTVDRNGQQKQFTGKLGANPRDPKQPLVGISPVPIKETYGPVASVKMATQQIVTITGKLGGFVAQLVTGEKSLYKNVSGPVGIASVSGTAISQGWYPQLLALISLNLALFNLLPVLPLDGGHLVIIAAEKVLGRPVKPETVNKIAAVGVTLVLALFLFATYADLSKLFNGQPFIPK